MKKSQSFAGIATPWFRMKRDEMGFEVKRIIDSYRQEQVGRRTRYIRNLEVYEGRRMQSYSAHAYVTTVEDYRDAFRFDRLRLVRSAVSSAVSSIYAAQKPKPQFQTLGATWATRRKAYRLDRICEGILNQRQERWINVWAFMADAGVEAALQGTAAIKVTANQAQRRIEHELVPLPDLFVDPAEGRRPQNLFQRAPIDEHTALEQWPAFRAAILGAKQYEWYGHAITSRPRATKVIEIVYAWRLPLSKDVPGHWCAVINGTVVEEGEWDAPAFPFVFMQWEPHRDGFWGSGIADEAGSLAEETSDLDQRLLIRETIASRKLVFYERDSVNPENLSMNDAAVMVPVEKGSQFPQESVVPAFAASDLDYLRARVSWFWDAIGVSQVSAAARREQGVQSGIAMMTLNDTKAGRQLLKAQRFEQAFVDLAHQYVWRLRELAEDEPDFAVTWPGKNLLHTIPWESADMEDDGFTVSVAPSSALPHDPAGRQEMVQQLYKSALISQDTAKELIGWPDLDSELGMENAEAEYIDSLIERYLDADPEKWSADDYEAPEGFISNKMGAIRRFASAWFRARIDQRALKQEERAKAEFNIDLLARWLKEMAALQAREQQSPAAPDQVAPAPNMPRLAPAPAPAAA